jgi:AcrR family transcriptional regulator
VGLVQLKIMPRKRASPPARRTPRQQRSRQAVKTILEATARLVESHGLQGLTTARIAEQAGYGVGTLYEYFPNKHTILVTMARQELDKVVAAIQKSLTQAEGEGTNSTTQRVIRALMRGFGGRQRLRGALLLSMSSEGHFSEFTTPIERIVEFLRRPNRVAAEDALSTLSSEQLYVLTRAVIGAIRAWAMEGGARISQQAMEVELARLVQSYVGATSSGNESSPA